MSTISSIVVIDPIASSNTEALTTVARAAELTGASEPVTAEDKPIEAKSLRPGKAARAVVSDGRTIRDAIEAVLAAPGNPVKSHAERMRRCATRLSPTRWT